MAGALRQRARASLLAGAALCLGAGAVRAEVIDLQWQEGSRFERRLTIAPGKFAEICGSLDAGQTVNWSFEADLAVDARQDYCWMWSNKTTASANLSVTLMRK